MVVLIGILFSYMFGYHFPSHAQLVSTGLPPKPEVFVNREQEQFDIINSLTTSGPNHSRIVTVTGAPGHGKSALATVCGYTLHDMGLRVRHIDLRSARTEEDIIKYILDVLGVTRSKCTRNELISKVKKEYSVVILILDNADYFTLSNEGIKDKFNDLMDLILENSHGIHIIITTQYKLKFTDSIRGHIPVQNLTEHHSLEFIDTCNPQIPHQQALLLVTYTEGIPLALKIISSLLQGLNGPDINNILTDLSFDPLHTLSPEDTNKRLNKVFSIATNYLSENDRLCFVVLTHFPSSFTHHAAISILGHFISDTACLQRLQHRSLLEYNPNIRRYHILHLLQLHGYNLRGIYQRQGEFNLTFAQHYMSEALSKTSQRKLFSYLSTEVHNVRYVLEVIANTDTPYNGTSSEVLVNFAKLTFDILPYHQPMKLVHSFWMSVHGSMKEVLAEGLSGQCVENFGVTVAFEVKLAVYLYYKNESFLYSRMGFFADTNVTMNMSVVGRLKQCVKDMDLLKYLIYLAIYNERQGNSTAYDGILKTAMKLFGNGTSAGGSELAYRMGTFLCEVGEHDLAIALLENAFKEKPDDFKIVFVLINTLRILDRKDQVVKVVETLERRFNESYGQKLNETCTTFIDGIPSLNCIKDLKSAGIAVYVSVIFDEMIHVRYGEQPAVADLRVFIGTLNNTLFNVVRPVNISEAELLSTFLLDHEQTHETTVTINAFEVAITILSDFLSVVGFTIRSMVELCRPYIGTPEITKIGMFRIDRIRNQPVPTNDWEIDMGLKVKEYKNSPLMGPKTIESFIEMMLTHKSELGIRDSFLKSKLPQLLETHGHMYTAVEYYATYFLSIKYEVFENFEVAKNYTEKALKNLPDVLDVDDKVREFLDLKLRVAKLELALHNYVTVLEILRNCSLTIAGMEDTTEPKKKDTHAKRDVSKVWDGHEVSAQRQFVHQFAWFFKKPILGQQIPAKLVSYMQFAVIFLTVWCLLAGIGVVVIETHYFLYLLHASLSPVYRVYYAIPANGAVWKGQPFLSLTGRWTKLRVFGVTLILTVVSYLAYIITYHTYNILQYLDYL